MIGCSTTLEIVSKRTIRQMQTTVTGAMHQFKLDITLGNEGSNKISVILWHALFGCRWILRKGLDRDTQSNNQRKLSVVTAVKSPTLKRQDTFRKPNGAARLKRSATFVTRRASNEDDTSAHVRGMTDTADALLDALTAAAATGTKRTIITTSMAPCTQRTPSYDSTDASPGVDSRAAMQSIVCMVYTPNIRGNIRNLVR
eukprot:996850-Prorocentrum_minimum.AAC.6